MTKDYRKFKTTFFELVISDPEGKSKVKLPHHILRLVEKLEFKEVWDNKNSSTDMLTVSFLEGSREPASPNEELGTKGLYNIPNEGPGADMNIAGSVTNRVGLINDLRFSGSAGITFLSPGEKRTGRIRKAPVKNVNGDTVSRLHKQENAKPVFLFQENNLIELTWGYKEDPDTVRTVTYRMLTFKVNYPKTGQIRTTIMAFDAGAMLDKLSPSETSIDFGEIIRTVGGAGDIGGEEVAFDENVTTTEMVENLCAQAGIACLVSPVLDLANAGSRKVWFVGQSFEQFMRELAKKHNSVYKVKIDPTTGKETLIFLTKHDLKKHTIAPLNEEYFIYKSAGSIILDLNVMADFKNYAASTVKTMTEEKKKNTQINQVSVGQFENKDPNSASATNLNNQYGAGVLLQKNTLGESNPSTGQSESRGDEDPASQAALAQNTTDKLDERKVVLSLTTLGFTGLSAGSINVQGIGLRYSGVYQVRAVTHLINNRGYTCKVIADTLSVPSGGTFTPKPKKDDEDEAQQLVTQFQKIAGHKTTPKRK
jgi:hypothetical protein